MCIRDRSSYHRSRYHRSGHHRSSYHRSSHPQEQLPGPFKSGRPDWNECGATRLKPPAHELRGSLLRGGGGKRVQGMCRVKEKGCEEGRVTW
eukprot:4744931-Prymnesium_polylepis.1